MESSIINFAGFTNAPVAQGMRAQPSEGWGRTFDSCRARHEKKKAFIMNAFLYDFKIE